MTGGRHPTAQVAQDLGITPNLLRHWKQEVTGDPIVPSQARRGVLRQAVVMRCRAIRAHGGLIPVRRLCRLLAVSPWLLCQGARPESPRAAKNRRLLAEIWVIHVESRRTYDSPRVHATLPGPGAADRCTPSGSAHAQGGDPCEEHQEVAGHEGFGSCVSRRAEYALSSLTITSTPHQNKIRKADYVCLGLKSHTHGEAFE